MITHYDMSSGELIEEEDRDPIETMPQESREPQPALRLLTVDEAVALNRHRRTTLPPDMAEVSIAVWLGERR